MGYHHGKAVFHGWSKLESYDAVFLKQKLHSSREKHSRLVNPNFSFSETIEIHFSFHSVNKNQLERNLLILRN